MNLILLGPPGAGKGTQANEIATRHKLIQLSTGAMLREAVAAKSPTGLKAEAVMKAGGLVSDDIVIGIVEERIAKPDCKPGFILDGFPRTLPQAAALEKSLKAKKLKLDAVIEMKVDDKILVERVAGRFSCTKCQAGYHDHFKPTKVANTCDTCGSHEFTRRADDNADTVKARLLAYYKETSPLVGFYYAKGILSQIDGMAKIDVVTAQIEAILTKVGRSSTVPGE
jgi:adenylate kinase